MNWHYRIVRHANGGLVLHEVYFDSAGTPQYRTLEGTTFRCDADEGPETIVKMLKTALKDARTRGVLDDPWPEKGESA